MADVTIRGAGIFGLSIAFACQRHGARVRVIDPGGVAAGASGGIVGALAPHVPENWNEKKAFQFDSLHMAEDYWAGVAEVSGQDPGYGRTGRIQPLADDAAVTLAKARQETSKDLWQGLYAWSVTQDALGTSLPSPSGYYVHDTLAARIHPRKACHALAAAIQKFGGDILRDGDVQGAEVWATGIHDLMRLSAASNRSQGGAVKGQAALLQYDIAQAPQLFAETLHFIPHADGTLAIGSTSERDFDAAHTVDAQLDEVIEKAVHILPDLADAPVIERWAGLRPRSRSRAPVLGLHPLDPGAFIANGGFKIGFGMAPKVGEVMAEFILGDCDTIPDSFKPEEL